MKVLENLTTETRDKNGVAETQVVCETQRNPPSDEVEDVLHDECEYFATHRHHGRAYCDACWPGPTICSPPPAPGRVMPGRRRLK